MTDGAPARRGSASDWFAGAVAAVALIVSFVSLLQSCDATNNAQKLEKREQASHVTFTRSPNGDGTETLSISNQSQLIIHEIVLSFPEDGSYIKVGSLEGCKVWRLTPLKGSDANGAPVSLDEPSRLDFIDAGEPPHEWTILAAAAMEQESKPDMQNDLTNVFYGTVDELEHCG
jgi:hypothetical protein